MGEVGCGAKFTPSSPDAWNDAKANEIKRLEALNPGLDGAMFAALVKRTIETQSSPELQFYRMFGDRVMTEYVTVVFLAHALCEAAINGVLTLGLESISAIGLFELLEKGDVRTKWTVGPKAIQSGYELPKGSALYSSLNFLTKQRNALVHYKTGLKVDGEQWLRPSKFQREPIDKEMRWIRRFFSLPFDLARYAAMRLGDHSPFSMERRFPIDIAEVHWP